MVNGKWDAMGNLWPLRAKLIDLNISRLARPNLCPEHIYDSLLLSCWRSNPKERPNFTQLLQIINDRIAENGEDVWSGDVGASGEAISVVVHFLVRLDRCQFKMLMLFSLWYWFATLWISSKFTKLHHHSRAHTHLYTHTHKSTLNLIHIEAYVSWSIIQYKRKNEKKNHSQRSLVHLLTRTYYVDVYTNIY